MTLQVARSTYLEYMAYLDRAKATDKLTAKAIVSEIEQIGREPIINEHSDGIRLEAGYDAEGRWHNDDEDTLSMHTLIRVCILGAIMWAVGIEAVRVGIHYAQKWGLPW